VVGVDVELEVHYLALELEGLETVWCGWGHHSKERRKRNKLWSRIKLTFTYMSGADVELVAPCYESRSI
jgi:hypothetical protein